MNKKESVAYGIIALHTLKSSANTDDITLKTFGEEMISIFNLHNGQEAVKRAKRLLTAESYKTNQ